MGALTRADRKTIADARDVLEAWKAGMRPDPEITVSEWADANRVLDSKSSREQGQWDTNRTPYLREPMDKISPYDTTICMAIMKGSQVGGTELGLNLIGFTIDVAPCAIMLLQPTNKMAEKFSKSRLQPMIDLTPSIAEKMGTGKGKKNDGNTLLIKEFKGGLLVMSSSNSASDASSQPIKIVIFEEPDRYPLDVDDEGSPIALVRERTNTFGRRRKEVFNCTPTLEANSVILIEYNKGTRKHWTMPCPTCQQGTVWHREYFRYTPGKPKSAHFVCRHCDKPMYEGAHKTQMLEAGTWIATNPNPRPDTESYYIPGSLSPVGWKPWAKIAQLEEDAVGNFLNTKSLMNTTWGLAFRDATERPDANALWERAKVEALASRQVPEWAVFLTAGVDIGSDHIEIGVWAWGRKGRRHLVEQVRLRGRPQSDPGMMDLLGIALTRRYAHPSGAFLEIRRTLVDRGYATDMVDPWAAVQDMSSIAACKGHGTTDWIIKDAKKYERDMYGKAVQGSVKLSFFLVGVDILKMEAYNRLNLKWEMGTEAPNGWTSFPNDLPLSYFQQMCGEEWVTKHDQYNRVQGHWRKVQMAGRVEALDCLIYARAAAHLEGLDEWTEPNFLREEAKMRDAARDLAVKLDTARRERLSHGDRTPLSVDDLIENVVRPGEMRLSAAFGLPVVQDMDALAALTPVDVEHDLVPVDVPVSKPFLPGMRSDFGNGTASGRVPVTRTVGVAKRGKSAGIPIPDDTDDEDDWPA